MKALLLSAGLGTRLKPFTDHHPKALAPVNGRTLLEWNIRNLQRFGITEVVVNVHHFSGQIIDLLEKEKGFGSRIHISDESAAVLETGGGLRKAAPFFRDSEDLLVMNVDILTNTDLAKMLAYHREHRPLATLAVQQRSSSRYFLFDTQRRLQGWENTQTGERKQPGAAGAAMLQPLAFSGIQVVQRALLDKISREGKFSLVDVYLDLCATETILAYEHTGDLLLDVGKPESLARAAVLFDTTFAELVRKPQ